MAKVDKSNRGDPTTKQVEGNNKLGVGGFGDNPEHRSDGRWDKEGSISYQYNYLLRLDDDERAKFKPNTAAQRIALLRVQRALRDDKDSLDETKEITDRTEGKAKQDIGLSADESIMPFIKGFVIPVLPDNIADIPDEEPDPSGE